jgi:hypothetical protein
LIYRLQENKIVTRKHDETVDYNSDEYKGTEIYWMNIMNKYNEYKTTYQSSNQILSQLFPAMKWYQAAECMSCNK